MLKIKLVTKNGHVIKAKTWRTDTIIDHSIVPKGGVEAEQYYFIRTGYLDYRQLSVMEAKAVLSWVDKNKIDADMMTMAECEEAIKDARTCGDIESETDSKQDEDVGGTVPRSTESGRTERGDGPVD